MLVNNLPYIWKKQNEICTPPHKSGDWLFLPAPHSTGQGPLWVWEDWGMFQPGRHSSQPMQGQLWDSGAEGMRTSPAPHAPRAPVSLRADLNRSWISNSEPSLAAGGLLLGPRLGQEAEGRMEGRAEPSACSPEGLLMVRVVVWDLSCWLVLPQCAQPGLF